MTHTATLNEHSKYLIKTAFNCPLKFNLSTLLLFTLPSPPNCFSKFQVSRSYLKHTHALRPMHLRRGTCARKFASTCEHMHVQVDMHANGCFCTLIHGAAPCPRINVQVLERPMHAPANLSTSMHQPHLMIGTCVMLSSQWCVERPQVSSMTWQRRLRGGVADFYTS